MLPTRLYFSNSVGPVLFVPESFIYLHITGEPMSSTELRALYVHAANLLARYKFSGILADHRAMPAAFETPDQEWLLTKWLPHAVPLPPVLRYAVLPSPSATRRLHTEAVLRDLAHHFIVRVFADLDSAAEWLKVGNASTPTAAAAPATTNL